MSDSDDLPDNGAPAAHSEADAESSDLPVADAGSGSDSGDPALPPHGRRAPRAAGPLSLFIIVSSLTGWPARLSCEQARAIDRRADRATRFDDRCVMGVGVGRWTFAKTTDTFTESGEWNTNVAMYLAREARGIRGYITLSLIHI